MFLEKKIFFVLFEDVESFFPSGICRHSNNDVVKKFQFHPITEVKRVKALKDFMNVRNGLLAHPLIHPFAEFTCSHATR